jgi:hypothetical protein
MVPEVGERATLLYAQPARCVLNHPHPYPPHKGEGAETARP